MNSETWGIVGGGLLGMTLAHRLRQQGKDVTLIEAAPQLGGLASAWTLGDIVWDRHYHVTLLSDLHLRGILREIGLEDEMEWRETRTGCFAEGKLYSVSNSLEFLKFPVLSLIGKLRLALTIFWASKIRNWKPLEQVSVAEWLIRWSGRKTYHRFWLPLLRSKLGENHRITSAAFIWATIARLYAARRTGLKKEMFGYVRGGYARVLQRFKEVLEAQGIRILLNRAVASIDPADTGLRVTFGDETSQHFHNVVVTAASPIAARLCTALPEDERKRLSNVQYQGIVCASLLLKAPLSEFYVTNLLDADLPFTGVIDMTALVDREYLHGHGLVYLPRYVAQTDPFFDLPDETVEESFLSALERMYPHFSRDDVLAFQISRVRYVCAIPTLGYSLSLPPQKSAVPGLYFVNSAHIVNGTLNVNETVQLAEKAARQFGSEKPGRVSNSAPPPSDRTFDNA